jgi:hypothetical protein
MGGCGGVLDVAFLLEILKFVLGKFRVWGFGEYFFEMFALRE